MASRELILAYRHNECVETLYENEFELTMAYHATMVSHLTLGDPW